MKKILCAVTIMCASVAVYAGEPKDRGLKVKGAFSHTTPSKPMLVQETGGNGDYPGHEVEEKQKVIRGYISLCRGEGGLAKYRPKKTLQDQWRGTSLTCGSDTPIVETAFTWKTITDAHILNSLHWTVPTFLPAPLFVGKQTNDTVSFTYTRCKGAAPVTICLTLSGSFQDMLTDQIMMGIRYDQQRKENLKAARERVQELEQEFQALLNTAKDKVAKLELYDKVDLGLEDNSHT